MTSLEFNLIKRDQTGDDNALNDLLFKEHRFIYNLMFQLTGERAEAEDLAQDGVGSPRSS